MKTTATFAAFAASAAAFEAGNQFLLYADTDSATSQRADPIITPGKISGHVHDFLGSNAFKPELSYEALMNGTDCTTAGGSDASAGGLSQDNSVYWHPALYAKAKDGSGYMKVPTGLHRMYYRVPPATKYAEPFEFPAGFRMVGGDAMRREANTDVEGITYWACMQGEGVPAISGKNGGFAPLNQACDAYTGLVAQVHFPHCWDGKDPGDRDPSEYTSYPEGNAESGSCPSSHPYALPHLLFEATFEMHNTYNEIDPSSIVLANGDATGYGMHADFFNGWETGTSSNGVIADLIDSCPSQPNQNAGLCGGYTPRSTARTQCKLENFFEEKDIENPGKALVGCNPITSSGEAPKLVVAALNVVSDVCDLLTGGTTSGSDDEDDSDSSIVDTVTSAAGEIMSALPGYSDASTPSTTFAVSTTAAATDPYAGLNWSTVDYGNAFSTPAPSAEEWDDDEDDDDEYDIVYEYVDVTATAEATVYARDNSHRHQHMHAHRRRNF